MTLHIQNITIIYIRVCARNEKENQFQLHNPKTWQYFYYAELPTYIVKYFVEHWLPIYALEIQFKQCFGCHNSFRILHQHRHINIAAISEQYRDDIKKNATCAQLKSYAIPLISIIRNFPNPLGAAGDFPSHKYLNYTRSANDMYTIFILYRSVLFNNCQ